MTDSSRVGKGLLNPYNLFCTLTYLGHSRRGAAIADQGGISHVAAVATARGVALPRAPFSRLKDVWMAAMSVLTFLKVVYSVANEVFDT
jgi:hypothetical protein